ncbi:hypothetical protein ACGRL8_08600 [Vibrio rumoiensis]|uniref:hypothetical protein n=1 Tax=Vibrio rumoiensis TaxID=76258 RepID=UPI003748A085
MKFKALYIVLMSVLLGACGGENSDLPKQGKDSTPAPAPAPEPEGGGDNTVVAPLASIVIEKQGNVKVGETLNAILTSCTNCVDSSLQYTWVIDSNDDGVYDINADTVVTGASLPLIDAYRKHSIRLSATVENSQSVVAKSNVLEFDGPLLAPVITYLKNQNDIVIGQSLELLKDCINCEPDTFALNWYADRNNDGIFSEDERIAPDTGDLITYKEEYKNIPVKVTATVNNADGEVSEEKYAIFAKVYPHGINADSYAPKLSSSYSAIRDATPIIYSDGIERVFQDSNNIVIGPTTNNYKYSRSSSGLMYWSDNEVGILDAINFDGNQYIWGEKSQEALEQLALQPSEIDDIANCDGRYLIKLKSGELKTLGAPLVRSKLNPSGNLLIDHFIKQKYTGDCMYIDQEGWLINHFTDQMANGLLNDGEVDLGQEVGEVIKYTAENLNWWDGYVLTSNGLRGALNSLGLSIESWLGAVVENQDPEKVKALYSTKTHMSYLTDEGELFTAYKGYQESPINYGEGQVENETFEKFIDLPIGSITLAVKNDGSIVGWGEAIYPGFDGELSNIKDENVKAYRANVAGTYFVMNDGRVIMKPNLEYKTTGDLSLYTYENWAKPDMDPNDLVVVETGTRAGLMIHDTRTKDLYIFKDDEEHTVNVYPNVVVATESAFYDYDGNIYSTDFGAYNVIDVNYMMIKSFTASVIETNI